MLDGLGKLRDGWLDTGDLARVDDDGFVHLAGRAKDLIIRGGHNIDPAIIENALLAHPGGHRRQAVGRPDVHAGEVPVAYVTLAPGATATAEELRAWASDRVARTGRRAQGGHRASTHCRSPPWASPTSPPCAPRPPAEAVADALRAPPRSPASEDGTVVEDGAVVAVVGLARGADETPGQGSARPLRRSPGDKELS